MYQISVLNAAVLCLGALGKETNGLPKSLGEGQKIIYAHRST